MSGASESSTEPKKSICPFCGTGCGLTYNEQTGKGGGWEASVNTRGEVCPKGVAAFEASESDDRLTKPLVRENGTLVTAPWAEAFDRIEEHFGDIVDEHGADALGFFASSKCTNEENYLLQKFARTLGTNNVDNCARLCHASTVAAMADRLGIGAMTNTLDDLTEADAYLITGSNPAEQHPIVFQSYLSQAIRDGTEMVHIDPRENKTTNAADVHVPVTPGYDIPVLNAMAKVVIEEDLVDEAFVEERTEGFERLKAHLDDVDVAENADLAGVDPETIREAARTFAEADRAAAFTGMGMSQHHYGTDNVHALINLALLTGNVGKRGTGVNPLRGQNNVQGAGDVGASPGNLPGYQPVTDADARERVAEVWDVEPPAEPGLTESEFSHMFGDEIKGAYVLGENPAITEPNLSGVDLDSLDFLVVQDIYETKTAEHADVVLPASSWAEKSGTVTNTDRRVQRMRPNLELPGEARQDLEILCEVGRRLTDANFDHDGPEDVFEELTAVNPLYEGMSYDGIGEDYQRWPYPADADSGTDVLHEETFFSGDRTADLVPIHHVPPADELDDDDLVLTTGRVLQHFNSGAMTRRTATLMRMRGEDVLQIHPDDAAERGIEDGDQVSVENDRGSVSVEAEVTPAITRGSVFVTFHYADPLVNSLTGEELDPVAKIPEYKHSAVRVEPGAS
ncbi:formate dehydrogenase subunit alpha [Haloarculaceae archaeon H-GB1-1]|nr:formate dehydrogenase subunit alpha [Haloarculaceae archaeon H-GB1-1]